MSLVDYKVDFSEWLKDQMNQRGIRSNAELARLANLGKDGRTVVWGWLKLGKQPSEESLQKLARALKMDVQEVYRAAGILPPKLESDEWIERIQHTVNQLPENERELVYRYAEMLREMLEKRNGKKKKPQS
jgi:transcriptional regulator with XRE-family HTH domain